MNLEGTQEIEATKLLWREQARAIPWSLWGLFLRLIRREPRIYLTMEGRVLARFVTDADRQHFMSWLATTHEQTFDYGFAIGKEHLVAHLILQQAQADFADAGGPGTE